MTSMMLSRLHYPVTNLGFGRRVGIWTQGCTLYCRGCVSRDTWPTSPQTAVDLADIRDWIVERIRNVDGITISGGEPTDQPAALGELLDIIADLRTTAPNEFDVLVFTGRSLEAAVGRVPALRDVDVVISEPFIQELVDGRLGLRGSTNQQVTAFSEIGRQRYALDGLDERYVGQRETMGVHVSEDSVWLVGIPRPGDLKILERQLADEGISLGRTSWLS